MLSMSQPPPIPQNPIGLNYAGRHTCPGCGGGPLEQPSFTLWGGAIGHKLLGVERCATCRKWWVKSTGQPGGTRIAIYIVTGILAGLILGALLVISQHH